GADEFDGIDDHVDVAYSSSLDNTEAITVEGWFKCNEDHAKEPDQWYGGNQKLGSWLFGWNGWDDAWCFGIYNETGNWTGGTHAADVYITAGEWVHVLGTFDGRYLNIYVNGELEDTEDIGSTTIYSNSNGIEMGIGGVYFNGTIDEVRISNVVRPIDWITTQYNNQNDSSTFYTLGSEELTNDFDDVIVGAYGYDNNRGWAYIFHGGPGFDGELLAASANTTITGSAPDDRFGWDVSRAGDVNNDGFVDMIVGAPGNNSDTGAAYIFYVNESMSSPLDAVEANVIMTGDSGGDEFGYSVSTARDVNDDGYNDVIVGAPGYADFNGTYSYEWGSSDTLVQKNDTSAQYSDVVIDPSGNPVFVWVGNDGGDINIYAMKLDSDGNSLWGPSDVKVNQNSTNVRNYPAVDIDSDGNIFVVWQDNRRANRDIYAQKLDPSGTVLWPSDVMVHQDFPNQNQYDPDVAVDSNGNAIIVWRDYRGPDSEIYAQKLDPSGAAVWSTSDVQVNQEPDDYQTLPKVVVDPSDNAIVTWEDDRFSDTNVYAQKLNSTGFAQWGATDKKVNQNDTGIKTEPDVAIDSSGNVIIVWEDNRDGDTDVYAQKLDLNGNPQWGLSDKKVNQNSSQSQSSPDVAVNSDGDAVVAWYDSRDYWTTYYEIYAQQLNFTGDAQWGVSDKKINQNPDDKRQNYPAVAVDQIGNIYIAWSDNRSDASTYIYAQKLSPHCPGRAYIYNGGSFMDSTADVILEGENNGDKFGFSVNTADDINGDGTSDVIVSAPYYDDGGTTDAGRIYVFEGGTSMDNTFDWIHNGENAFDHFGWSVSYAGDVNGDDLIEIIVGAPNNDDGGVDAGKVYLLTISSPLMITDVIANPSIQNIGDYVNITCNVMASSGINGVWVNITLPGGGYTNTSMMQGTGNQWYHNDNYTTVGIYLFHIWTEDINNNWVKSGIFVFEVVNRPPILTMDKVFPVSGSAATWFNFTVTYTDLDNHPSDDITLNLTGPSGGIYNLFEVNIADSDYTDGKEYYYNLTLSAGSYSFHFAANDSLGYWDETSDIDLPIVGISNPILSDQGVWPISGYVDTWFNFTVNYSHPLNNIVDNITLNLTGPSGGTYYLIEVDSSDTNYIDGKLFYYNLSGLDVGNYIFHFAANDTNGNWSESAPSGFDVLNRAPILSQDEVDPTSGLTDTYFNFTVNYTDLNNHDPDTITVNITGVGEYDLMEIDLLDMNYTDGKDYYLNISGFGVGQYTFHFAANDTIGNWTESLPLIFEVFNRAPVLSLGEVIPTSGFTDTWFNFTVTYTDLDNHEPDTITVNVTGEGVHGLMEVNPLDVDYTDGKDYYYNQSGFGVGQYTFHFAANDTIGNWVESLPSVFDVLNRVPMLSLDEVDPISGFIDTWFNFTVTYTDLDNQTPDIITVNITGGGDYDMKEVNSLDIDYSDGKEYYYNLSGFAVGQHTFHFSANDTMGNWVESLPLVFDVLNRIPMLSLDDVDPISGFTDTWFNFTVTYTDLDNQYPGTITVNITGVGEYDLIEANSLDMDYTDGKEYYYNLSGFGVGQYSFHFAANDSLGSWTESTPSIFAVVNRNPLLTQDKIDPTTGFIDTWFNFTVAYTDLDNHAPEIITLNITGVGIYDLSEVNSLDNDYMDGKDYYLNMSGFAVRQYIYHFAANDTLGTWTESLPLIFDVINRAPLLSFDNVDPSSGYTDTWFNFTVTYTDLDNHEPDTITVNISGVGDYDLIEANSLDNDYTDGKEYYYNLSGFAVGQYSFHFSTNDTLGDWNEGGVLWFEVANRVPILSDYKVEPTSGYTDTWFNFTVNYTDVDNHEPDIITVNITGVGVYDLIESELTDNDYTDGKEYYVNITGLVVGQYIFHFAASDIIGYWTITNNLWFDVINRVPTLSQDSVDPTSGNIDNWFNFTVTYTDFDNHAPDVITLNITYFGIIVLYEVDPSDTDYTDGKEYYYNTTLPNGLYTYHFAANDSVGWWAQDTNETNAPLVTLKNGVLNVIDITKKYSEVIYLNATFFDDHNDPILDENVSFYIDLNDNGIYEEWEFAGEGAALVDGTISVIYSNYLATGQYDFICKYNGSGDYKVDDDEGLIIIDPKEATLTSISDVIEQGETTFLTALLLDIAGNPIEEELVEFYLDKNKNHNPDPSEIIGVSITSPTGVASIIYIVDLIPENYDIWTKYIGSGNYSVNEIKGTLMVQNTSNNAPTILWPVPNQEKPEDSLPWTLNLTPFEADIEDYGSDLKWYLTGVDTSLYSVTGMYSDDDILTFIPEPDAYGNDEVILWLADSNNATASQILWINITPVNDLPFFYPSPPNIMVHYDDPNIDDDDPAPWDYTYYVHDIETPVEGLTITTSEPTVDSGNGYVKTDGLKATYHYPQSRVGKSVLVVLTLSDGTDIAQTMIVVDVTSDWIPEKVKELPDIVLNENSTLYNVFDLDEYFTDKDHDILFYTSGHFNVDVKINENHTVDMTALGHWIGTEYVTFRARDPVGAFVEDTIKVTVIPVNDPPIISGVPDLVVHYDYSYEFDLSSYIIDHDNLSSELTLWTSESTDYVRIQQYNNLGLIVNYPKSMNGLTRSVTLYVSDGEGFSSQEIQISVTSDFPPELVKKLPDVSFDEDTSLENAFKLSDYFLDIDGDALYYTNRTEYLNVTINEDLTVDFTAPENWFGYEVVIFRATDPTGAMAEDRIMVVVVPVNDAPTLDTIPKQEKREGEQWILDLSYYIGDVDNVASDLTTSMVSEVGQGYVSLVGNILIFQYPEDVREDIIIITVSDGELETTRSFIVSIQASEPVAPSFWDTIPWPWIFFTLLAVLGEILIFSRRKGRFWVYEAFLIHEKGLPIAHASRGETSELEDVVVSGMFTAVQDFISDAFSEKTSDDGWELDEMKFGENKILIERSQNLYLAVIFEGNGDRLRVRVKKLLSDIIVRYGEELKDWNGDMSELKGIREMILSLFPKKGGRHPISETLPVQIHLEEQSVEIEGNLISYGETGEVQEENLDEYVGGFKEALAEDGEVSEFRDVNESEDIEEIVEYECPICGERLGEQDKKCPRCGIKFAKIEDLLKPAS
ncbi:MAG: FG-GAP repeat protein, partial [Thermoplasmata archaeon]